MIVQIKNYQIRPYANNLCWELWEYREVRSKDEDGNETSRMDWVSLKCYPSTFGYALEHVYERLMKDSGEVVGVEGAITVAKALRDEILAVADPKEKE